MVVVVVVVVGSSKRQSRVVLVAPQAIAITPPIGQYVCLDPKAQPQPQPGCLLSLSAGVRAANRTGEACVPSKQTTHLPTNRDDFPGGVVKSFWEPRRVTRINCGTLSKTARAGQRTWTRATPRDATRRRRRCSRTVARRTDICTSALPAELVSWTTYALRTALL